MTMLERASLSPLSGRTPRGARRHAVTGWKINYPEIGYPEFCQLIEQENRDPNKALGQSIQITVYLEFAFWVVYASLSYVALTLGAWRHDASETLFRHLMFKGSPQKNNKTVTARHDTVWHDRRSTVSSHKFQAQQFKARSSNPTSIAYFNLIIPLQSSKYQDLGPTLRDWPLWNMAVAEENASAFRPAGRTQPQYK